LKECRKSEDLLARYLHGEALLQDRDLLEKHISVCPDCERLYRAVSDVDRLLRDLPGKQVDPPAWLSARILANLPEERAIPAWQRWGRWAAGLGAVAACAVAVAFTLLRGVVPQEPRVASAPPSAPSPSATALPPGGSPPAGEGATVLRSTPGARPRGAEETAVASAPKVRVIQQVKIFFYYPPAQKVSVTGDFNGWDVDGVPMQAAGKPGMWTTELRLPPGVYSYNFIVDGEILLPDPNAPNQMPDGYGGTNSILLVKGENAI
jgi:anti-sigma factor RsiW